MVSGEEGGREGGGKMDQWEKKSEKREREKDEF